MKRLHCYLIILMGMGILLFLLGECRAVTVESVVGIYRCYEYNVGGSADNCRNFTTQFTLKLDGTYTFGSRGGTYKIEGNKILFSEEKLRGHAILLDGNKFRFTYTSPYSGWKVVQTYLRSGSVKKSPNTDSSTKQP
ncbi:MAG: hypothetical protein HYY07_01080 [Elusimicrobia bacterium]|nr:hypothetical protein [Elusimicrobiota bacterium]MBI4218029.1 hypothetical protein [Elusimicrobiota bacterium]